MKINEYILGQTGLGNENVSGFFLDDSALCASIVRPLSACSYVPSSCRLVQHERAREELDAATPRLLLLRAYRRTYRRGLSLH